MASRDSSRPNIVFILADDLGHWGMGCAGNEEIRTPALDRLASTGSRFESFFCASPVCSPARASILTGRIPSQHGVHDFIRTGNVSSESDTAIEYLKGQPAYTDVLSANGYVCCLSGKWHVGRSALPQKGFSHWYAYALGGSSYYDAPFIRDGQIVRDERYVTDVMTENALKFLSETERDDKPFYLSVHYTAPHSPWDRDNHPKDVYDSYDDCPFKSCPDEPVHPWQINSAPRGTGQKRRRLLKGYYAAVTGMDACIGRIIDKIEAMGIRRNTLILFTSDNGMNMGHHGIFGKGNGTFPMNMYDTSVKVPMIISRPGSVPEGVVNAHLLSHYDLMPTLLDYTGLENPEAGNLPGASFAPLLRGEELEEKQDVVVFDEYGPVRMIRNREWKYVHRYPYGPNEFYDLKKDPEERRNLTEDAGHAGTIEEMRRRLQDWFVRYTDPMLDGTKEPVTGKGQVNLAGPAGGGRKAFEADWFYLDADGQRR